MPPALIRQARTVQPERLLKKSALAVRSPGWDVVWESHLGYCLPGHRHGRLCRSPPTNDQGDSVVFGVGAQAVEGSSAEYVSDLDILRAGTRSKDGVNLGPGCQPVRPSHASEATTMAAVPVSSVGLMAGAKCGEWLAGMSWETVPAASAFAYNSGSIPPRPQ